jgi:hypothetical protein
MNELIDRISDYLAHNKALPVLIGVGLIVLNYIVQFFGQVPVISFVAHSYLLMHLGVIVGLVGILIGDAL